MDDARPFPARPCPEKIMADVTIYTRQFCGYCSRAKALLQSKGVDYVEHDATYSQELRQEMIGKANGSSTFPQIFINGQHVGGCDDLHALDRAGKLDPMLAN
jgi:glutaredoxin 3